MRLVSLSMVDLSLRWRWHKWRPRGFVFSIETTKRSMHLDLSSKPDLALFDAERIEDASRTLSPCANSYFEPAIQGCMTYFTGLCGE